jgi:beta-glucosidase
VNPSGRLPLVVPKREEDLPHFNKKARTIEYDLWHGYRRLDREGVTPAFPFGFGLSYTTYRYARLAFETDRLTASETLQATVDVTNTGALAGEDVVQLYFGVTDSVVERAPRQLAAFARVALRPGETKAVRLSVPVSRLGYYHEELGAFVVEPATYEITVGGHSQDAQALRGSVTVE